MKKTMTVVLLQHGNVKANQKYAKGRDYFFERLQFHIVPCQRDIFQGHSKHFQRVLTAIRKLFSFLILIH